jgi:hypothetical protein
MMVDGGKGKNGLKSRDVIYSQDILTTMKATLCNHGLCYRPDTIIIFQMSHLLLIITQKASDIIIRLMVSN